MNRIRVFTDNMFSGIPMTRDSAEMKRNMTESMEEKFEAMSRAGINEDEAFGRIVSEFGSVDELKKELGMEEQEGYYNSAPDSMEAEYQDFHRKYNTGMAVATGLCILAFAVYFLFSAILRDVSNFIGFGGRTLGNVAVILFLVVIAAAVMIFVYYGLQNNRYKQMGFGSKGNIQQLSNSSLYSLIMMGAVAFYLVAGSIFGLWHPTWVVFPVAAFVGKFITMRR